MSTLGELLHGGPTTDADLDRLEDKLFVVGSKDQKDRLVRFFVMLMLAAAIATGGVIADSTAVVIGAMIIAPLMTPILGSALGIATGRGRRFWQQFGVVALGVLTVLAVAILMDLLLPGFAPVTLEGNSQVLSRVHPSLVELGVALLSGFAGAFAVSRTQVADAIPGVAVSISLVPPLAVTGLSIVAREWEFAAGSALLFVTNLIAILAAGSLVFLVFGFGGLAVAESHPHNRVRGLLVLAVSMGLLVIPLAGVSVNVAGIHALQVQTQQAVEDWVAETEWEPLEVRVSGPGEATIRLGGSGRRPDVADLLTNIDQEAGRQVALRIEYQPLERVDIS